MRIKLEDGLGSRYGVSSVHKGTVNRLLMVWTGLHYAPDEEGTVYK